MKTETKHSIIYTILAIYALFFNTERFTYFGIVLIVLSYILLTLDTNKDFRFKFDVLTKSLLFVLVFMSIFSLGIIVLDLTELGSITYVFKEVSRLIIYIAIIQCMNFISISNNTYIKVWRVLLCIVVLVSIIQFTKIYDVNSLLISLYGDSVQYLNTKADSLSLFRSGSVFVNPNVCATFLCAFLGMYLNYINYVEEKTASKVFTFVVLFTGILLTGSRTGIILSLLLLLLNLIRKFKVKQGGLKYLGLILIPCVVIAVLMLNIDYSGLRGFQFEQGLDNSISIKMDIWQRLLTNMNAVNLLFGYSPFNYHSGKLLVDFDFGYLTTYYGICGVLIFILMIYSILKYKSSVNTKLRKGLNLNFLLIFLVFGLTASVYFNLRIFVLCELLFCVSFSNDKGRLA